VITREQLKKDIVRLVEISYQHLPWTADRFFSAIRQCADRLDDALGSFRRVPVGLGSGVAATAR